MQFGHTRTPQNKSNILTMRIDISPNEVVEKVKGLIRLPLELKYRYTARDDVDALRIKSLPPDRLPDDGDRDI